MNKFIHYGCRHFSVRTLCPVDIFGNTHFALDISAVDIMHRTVPITITQIQERNQNKQI